MSEDAGPLHVDADVRRARTPPASFYRDAATFDLLAERVLARSWLCVDRASRHGENGRVEPLTLLPGVLDEPLLLARDGAGELRALGNACTHRGHLVALEAGCPGTLRCRYHGRRFGLDGLMLVAPGFEGAQDFPSASDDLPRVPLARFGDLLFTSLRPAHDFAALAEAAQVRTAWLAPETFAFDAATSRDYEMNAHWALYCENWLEAFHVPHVHQSLAGALDMKAYRTHAQGLVNMQVGLAAEGEPAFEPPPGHPDHGQRVAAWYFFLFPATMLNFYPWGLSVNVVEPLAPERTRVRYLSYVRDASLRDAGAGAGLHRVELEDEAVVEATQSGLRSRLYERGRYAPRHEHGVHAFHRLLAELLARP